MSYIELGDTIFRGQLVGATGEAKFKLSASSVDVIDTPQLAGNTASYYLEAYGSKSTSNNNVFVTLNFNVSPGYLVEVTAYSNRLKHYTIDGVARDRSSESENLSFLPISGVYALSTGSHVVRLVGNSSGTATYYVYVRYIKQTGVL